MIETGWERRSAAIAPPREEVVARIERALPGATVTLVAPLAGGHCNTNLRVDLADGRVVVLRLFQRDRDACAREAAILRLLEGKVPVPRVLHVEAAGEPPSLVQTLCPGRRVCDVLPALAAGEAEALGRRVGQDLGRIHALRTFPRAGLLGPDLAVRESLEGLERHLERMLSGRAGERLGRDVTRDVRAWIVSRPDLLAPVREAVLVHADFKTTNLLAREDEGRVELSAVLDWEFAFAGPRLFDVGQLLRHDDDPRLAPFATGFTAGYAPALEGRWREQAAALDLLNLLGFLDDADERPVVQGDARRLILRTLARWR